MHDGSPITLRQYLMAKAIEAGCDVMSAVEAVALDLRLHPTWDANRVAAYATFEKLVNEGGRR